MKIRNQKRPPVTWAFRKSTAQEKILCDRCKLRELPDYCPRFSLGKIQREEQIATRCYFLDPVS